MAKKKDMSGFSDIELFNELMRRTDVTEEPELKCESIDARMQAAEREIAMVLRRHKLNGIIGLCYGMHARGAVLQDELSGDAKEDVLIRCLVIADQLRDLAHNIVEGLAARVRFGQAAERR